MIWLGHSKIWRTETVLNDWEKQERIEGGRRGGGGCVLGRRDLLWEETRTEGAGKQKLGHMEKSSCNDPTLGPAHSSHVCLSSCLSVHHLWSSVKLLCPSSSPETAAVCLHLCFWLLFLSCFSNGSCTSSSVTDISSNYQSAEVKNNFPLTFSTV